MFFLLALPFTSAQSFNFDNISYAINDIIEKGIEILTPFFQKVIGDYSTSSFFFTKILFLILLTIIIKNILDRTPIGEGNKNISIIISSIVSVIAIRFIQENEFFEAILIQYGVLGIAITTILPMVIFFYFIHNTKVGTFGRKMFWGIYAITLGAIWMTKANELPEIANWIYGLTFVAAIIFIFLDKSIHSYFGLSEFTHYEKKVNKKMIRKILKDLDELEEDYRNGRVTERDYKYEKRNLRNQIKEFSKE